MEGWKSRKTRKDGLGGSQAATGAISGCHGKKLGELVGFLLLGPLPPRAPWTIKCGKKSFWWIAPARLPGPDSYGSPRMAVGVWDCQSGLGVVSSRRPPPVASTEIPTQGLVGALDRFTQIINKGLEEWTLECLAYYAKI